MNRHYPYIIMLLVLIMVPSLVSVGMAALPLASAYKLETARSFLKAGQLDNAIDDLKKCLLIDPVNEEARELLERLDPGSLRRQPLSMQLSNPVEDYSTKMRILEQQKADMEAKLSRVQSEKEHLISTNLVKDFEKDLLQEKIDLLTQKMSPVELKEFKQFVADERAQQTKAPEKLDFQLTYAEKEQRLNAIKAKFASLSTESADYSSRLLALENTYGELREKTFGDKSSEDHVFQVLEDYLYFKKQMGDQLNGEGAAKAESLSGYEHKMLSKMEELLALHESIGTYIRFMEKRNQAIRKDNSMIASLRNQMNASEYDSTRPNAMQKATQIRLGHAVDDLEVIKEDINKAQQAN